MNTKTKWILVLVSAMTTAAVAKVDRQDPARAHVRTP
jgi:hypothetical protein